MKNYMKKIISMILAVCLVLGSASVFATDKAKEAENRLTSLGITLSGEADSVVKRAEVASVIVKLVTNNAVLPVPSDAVFYDVPKDNAMAGEIYYAYQMGWISGVSENSFAPENPATLQQFIKIAASALGYRTVAENAGGYVGGYYTAASKIGLLKNLKLSESANLTKSDVLMLLNNMLDAKTLEPVIGTDELKVSEDTLFEQLMEMGDLKELKGIVEAVGKYYLSDGEKLSDGKIMIDSLVLLYDGVNAKDLLGKEVTAYYRKSEYDAIATVVNISVSEKTAEAVVDAKDITLFNKDEIEYFGSDDEEEEFNLTGAEFVYNGSVISPESVSIPLSGRISLLDREDDGDIDVVFISEYESFIVDRISETNHTVYFKNDAVYRGKMGFWFDFDNKNKEYAIFTDDGEEITFDDIKEGMVFSASSNMAESLVTVIVSDEIAEGLITSIASGDFEITIGEETYTLYKAGSEALLSEYKVGQKGKFALNHNGEVVGTVGELFSDGLYAYVLGYNRGRSFETPKIRVIVSGTSNKEIEVSGDDEIIKYTYTNGVMTDYELADKVALSISGGASDKIASNNISSEIFNRAAIYYKLNAEGKICELDVYSVPLYTTAQRADYYAFSFNGELNSFGGYAAKDAFFIGEATQVISVPTADFPDEDDYTVDATITDESSYTIMPIKINETTQIAECAILFANMDANTPKPFTSNDKISIVGDITKCMDEKGEEYYKLEVLTEDKVKTPIIYAGTNLENIVSRLVCGDLIRYNTKSNGEIGNIEKLQSLYALGNSYFINREGSTDEACFAKAHELTLNRLDNLRNERVDSLVVSTGTRQKLYTILREDGPAIYSYNRKTGEIKTGVTDEIASADRVGEGASDVFLLVNENEPKVLVVLAD